MYAEQDRLSLTEFTKSQVKLDQALQSRPIITGKVRNILDDISSSRELLQEMFEKKQKSAEEEGEQKRKMSRNTSQRQ